MSKEKKPEAHISRLVVKADKSGVSAYEIEFEFPYGTTPQEFESARQKGLEAIRRWLGEKLPAEAGQPKALDPVDLDKLPWKAYKEGHRAGWVFADKVEQLAEVIRHSETGKMLIGEFEYAFSGPKDQDPQLFIRRTPIESKKDAQK